MKLKAINYHVIVQIQNTALSQHVSHPFSKASEDICRVDPEGCSLKRTTTVKALNNDQLLFREGMFQL